MCATTSPALGELLRASELCPESSPLCSQPLGCCLHHPLAALAQITARNRTPAQSAWRGNLLAQCSASRLLLVLQVHDGCNAVCRSAALAIVSSHWCSWLPIQLLSAAALSSS